MLKDIFAVHALSWLPYRTLHLPLAAAGCPAADCCIVLPCAHVEQTEEVVKNAVEKGKAFLPWLFVSDAISSSPRIALL